MPGVLFHPALQDTLLVTPLSSLHIFELSHNLIGSWLPGLGCCHLLRRWGVHAVVSAISSSWETILGLKLQLSCLLTHSTWSAAAHPLKLYRFIEIVSENCCSCCNPAKFMTCTMLVCCHCAEELVPSDDFSTNLHGASKGKHRETGCGLVL